MGWNKKKPHRGKTGSKRNAHFFDFGSSGWTHSFERSFDKTDSMGAEAVASCLNYLQNSLPYNLARNRVTSWMPFTSASTRMFCDIERADWLHQLFRVAISVVCRSPSFRHSNSFLNRGFFENGGRNEEIGQHNVWNFWSEYYRDERRPTQNYSVVFLISGIQAHLISGDGYFTSMDSNRNLFKNKFGEWERDLDGYLLFPISPEVAVLFLVGSKLISDEISVLSKSEVDSVNELVRMSSREQLFGKYVDVPPVMEVEDEYVRNVSIEKDCFLTQWIR